MAAIEWRIEQQGTVVKHSAYVGGRPVASLREVRGDGDTVSTFQVGRDSEAITLEEARAKALKLSYARAIRAREKASEIVTALERAGIIG